MYAHSQRRKRPQTVEEARLQGGERIFLEAPEDPHAYIAGTNLPAHFVPC